MTGAQAVIVYVICWWMLLQMVSAIGMGSGEEKPEAGQKQYRLGLKCAAVTVLAAGATWAIDFAIRSGIVAVY